MDLSDYGETLAHDVAFWLMGFDDPGNRPEWLGKLSLELSTKLRTLAIITLLVKGERDFFFQNLVRSGDVRASYLRRIIDAGLPEDHHRSLGRFEPLLDLVAAGDLDRVHRIAALSPTAYRPGHEYEDDYWYAALLHELCRESPDEARLESMLDSFEKALEGSAKTRLDICRALVTRDQERFPSSFQELLSQHEIQITEDRGRGTLDEATFIAHRQICIEALAMLRLAQRRGLSTDEGFAGYLSQVQK
jgi:hypothetical protein